VDANSWFVTILMYAGMILDSARRHPKVPLIFALLAYAGVCFAHLSLYDNSKPFFTLSAFLSLFAAVPLIILYKPEEERQRLDILSTEPSWFDEN
jgi:hypothetical protein